MRNPSLISGAVVVGLLLGFLRPAQAEEPRRTVVLADVGLHILAVGAQHVVSPRIALQGSVGIYVPWTQTKDVAGLGGGGAAPEGTASSGEPRGAMVRLRPFFYLGENALRGLWLSPFVQGGFVSADRQGVSKTGPAGAVGVSVGYAWLIASRVHVSLGAGPQLHGAKLAGGAGYPSFFRVFPNIDLAVGYAFLRAMRATSFDVVIVGAGIAGTAAAGMLAREGARVLLLDARSEERAGAGWVNGVPGRAFDAAGVARPEGDELAAATHAFSVMSPSSAVQVSLTDHGVLEVDMRLLGARLRREAREAGATLRFSSRVSGAELSGGRLRAIEAPSGQIRAALFVDASGLPAVVRRSVFPAWPGLARRDLCLAAQAVFSLADVPGAERFLARQGGISGRVMAWVGIEGGFSVRNVRVDLESRAVAILTGSIQDREGRASGAQMLAAFVAEQPWIGERLFGGAGAIPLRRPYARLGAPGLALLGDAGCLTFSAHGSGIGTGLLAARALSQAVGAAADPGASARTWAYAAAVHASQGGLLLAYDLIRRVSQDLSAEDTETMLAAGLASPESLRAAFEQLPPPLGPRELVQSARRALSAPRLSLRLGRKLRALPRVLAHGASYPQGEDLAALRIYEAESARLVGDSPDPLD